MMSVIDAWFRQLSSRVDELRLDCRANRHRIVAKITLHSEDRMLKYEYLKEEWIVSPTARRVYRISASLSLALFFGMWLTFFEGGIPEPMAAVARLLFFAGALGAGITFVGMEFFLFRFDDSHPLKQVVWFCIMLVPLLGAALYCLIVYSRSEMHGTGNATPVEGVPLGPRQS